jgi:hypothetical protein
MSSRRKKKFKDIRTDRVVRQTFDPRGMKWWED